MSERLIVRRGAYHDSVAVMLASRDAEVLEGIVAAAAVMGTPLNLQLLAQENFALPDPPPGPNDLVIALRGVSEEILADALHAIEARLTGGGSGGAQPKEAPRSARSAVRRRPSLNLALVSVPGRWATYEVAEALEAGLHVFCFSGGLTLAEEALLKRRALERGLLLLGPECGTAIVDGVGLGFANVVRPGPVGIVGASGTGIQEVACLLDLAGVGVSQAVGVGGRDLSREVGGLMTLRALELLAEDPPTEIVVLVAKQADPAVAERVASVASGVGKPVVTAPTLEEAARRAAELAGSALPDAKLPKPPPSSGAIRGLFSGGTLLAEAATVLGTDATLVDFGDEAYTEGRPHPIIDPTLRLEALAREAADQEVGVVLLDLVLGRGAHSDPASVFAPAVASAGATIVVALCGAAGDPQRLEAQAARLQEAGALVVRGTARAARLALEAAR